MAYNDRPYATSNTPRRVPSRTFRLRSLLVATFLTSSALITFGIHAIPADRAGREIASPPPVARVMSSGPYSAIIRQRLGRQFSITKRACGFTFVLQRVYADINQVVVVYTMAAPSGRSLSGIFGVDSRAAFPQATINLSFA